MKTQGGNHHQKILITSTRPTLNKYVVFYSTLRLFSFKKASRPKPRVTDHPGLPGTTPGLALNVPGPGRPLSQGSPDSWPPYLNPFLCLYPSSPRLRRIPDGEGSLLQLVFFCTLEVTLFHFFSLSSRQINKGLLRYCAYIFLSL